MKEIKFTTHCEPVLSFEEEGFKRKYEEKTAKSNGYRQEIGGDTKYLALCPRCDNPVVILGVYRKIDVAPHARHAKGVNIPGIAEYKEYKYLNCPYHRKRANYVKEYVPETEEPQRHELYRIAKEHYDKAIYLLQKQTGIYITLSMAESIAENYATVRAYNYIDATLYNIPWYLLYSFYGFPLYRMIVRKNTTIYKHLVHLGFRLKESKIKEHVYIENNNGYLLIATDYRYSVDKNDTLNEWLDFSIIKPDDTISEALLYTPVDRFSVRVDSSYFGNLIEYKDWNPRQNLLEIADRYMNP